MADHPNIVKEIAEIASILRSTKSIAVLGIKPESRASQPAFFVPRYMASAGYHIIPVPVYYPEVTEILGLPIYRKLQDVPGHVDMVNVFRKPADINKHVDEILAIMPDVVWFQLGIVNDEAALAFAAAGIKVIQDKCIMIEHRYL